MNFIYVQILVTSDRKLVIFSIIATFLNRFRRVAFLVHSTPSDLRSGCSIYHFIMWHIPLRCKWHISFRYKWHIPIRFEWFFYSATGGSDSPLYPVSDHTKCSFVVLLCHDSFAFIMMRRSDLYLNFTALLIPFSLHR